MNPKGISFHVIDLNMDKEIIMLRCFVINEGLIIGSVSCDSRNIYSVPGTFNIFKNYQIITKLSDKLRTSFKKKLL